MKVLLAVDHSQATQAAVAFAGKMLGPHPTGTVEITLFHVTESLPDELIHRADDPDHSAYHQVAQELVAGRKDAGEALLAAQRDALLKAGIAEGGIERRLITREAAPGAGKVVAAMAIIEEMRAGDYEIVCLGRRGDTGAEGSFLGSVAEKVLREARGRTVWVVD